MPETLQKLQPDRDLQCYFFEPSAVAALSATSSAGYTVSGTWREQFDWAVIEWNRDNVFEHPAFRDLPDGDLSGLTLSYQETRENCILLDSTLFPTVDWPTLRIWANNGSGEQIYKIPLTSYATPIAGSYQSATVEFTIGGTATVGDYVGLAFLSEHYPYQLNTGDSLAFAIENIVAGINAFSTTMQASASGETLTITYLGTSLPATSTTGANGNLIGAYSYVSGAATEVWDAPSKLFSGGTSPSQWQITLPFASLSDPVLGAVPATAIRKLRWTYSAALQAGAFVRSEFQVLVSNWTVTGSGQAYSIAGPGSQRVEDDSSQMQYAGTWATTGGNFSGGTIHSTSVPASSVSCTYTFSQSHSLYLGTRLLASGTVISIVVDAGSPVTLNLDLAGEDVLIRTLLGQPSAGTHSVTVTHDGVSGTDFYFDFLEIAVLATTLPIETSEVKLAAATDWDTEHSLALAPERTAWMIHSLGFQARVNHYVGALWFYELTCVGQVYASATITFSGISRCKPHNGDSSGHRWATVFHGHHDSTFEPYRRHHGDAGNSFCALAERGLHGGLGAGQRQSAHHLLARHGIGWECDHDRDQREHHPPHNHDLRFRNDRQRGWQLVYRSGGSAPPEPRRPRLEPELLSSAERLWIRRDGVV